MIRREVLKLGAMAAGVAMLPAAADAAAEAAARSAVEHLEGFVVDDRFPHSLSLAEAMPGLRHRVDGDVTALWYDHLDAVWRRPIGRLEGATGEDVLFVLERLAWDRGRRVIDRRVEIGAEGRPLVRWTIASIAPNAGVMARG